MGPGLGARKIAGWLTMAAGGIDMMAARISEACEAGEKFIEMFYDTVDKRRQVGCSTWFRVSS